MTQTNEHNKEELNKELSLSLGIAAYLNTWDDIKLGWYIYFVCSILCWIGTLVVWYGCITGLISYWGNAIICTILDCVLTFLLIKFRIKLITMVKSYTDVEQSEKLVGILPNESADHHYVRKVTDFEGNPVDGKWSHPKYGDPHSKYANYIVQNFTSYEVIPCWSLAALIEVMPEILIERVKAQDGYDGYYYFVAYKELIEVPYKKELIDACVEMIIKLHEEKLI